MSEIQNISTEIEIVKLARIERAMNEVKEHGNGKIIVKIQDGNIVFLIAEKQDDFRKKS